MAPKTKDRLIKFLREHPGEWFYEKDLSKIFNMSGRKECAVHLDNCEDMERKKVYGGRGYVSMYRSNGDFK